MSIIGSDCQIYVCSSGIYFNLGGQKSFDLFEEKGVKIINSTPAAVDYGNDRHSKLILISHLGPICKDDGCGAGERGAVKL